MDSSTGMPVWYGFFLAWKLGDVSIRRKSYTKLNHADAHTVYDGPSDASRPKFQQLSMQKGESRPCTEKRFSQSYPSFYAETDSLQNVYG